MSESLRTPKVREVEPAHYAWSEEQNLRRCELIDKQIDGSLSPTEAAELERLQQDLYKYRNEVAPLQLRELRKLHADLLGIGQRTSGLALRELTGQQSEVQSQFVPTNTGYLRVKRVLDVMMSAVLLVLTTPIIVIAGVLVKATSRGPMVYCQMKAGKDGRPFMFFKFRTMVIDAEAGTGPVWCTADDPRITPLGRLLRSLHIDELPSLVNVLLGYMSLVGPRPERPEFVARLEWEFPCYRDRLRVRPGITGLAQLRLPPATDLESVRRKLVHDLYYVRHVNLWLDFQLVVATGWSLIREWAVFAWNLMSLPSQGTVETDIRHVVGPASEDKLNIGPADARP